MYLILLEGNENPAVLRFILIPGTDLLYFKVKKILDFESEKHIFEPYPKLTLILTYESR